MTHQITVAAIAVGLLTFVIACGKSEEATCDLASISSPCMTIELAAILSQGSIPQDLAPFPGSALRFSTVGANSLTVAWDVAIDDVSDKSLLEYQLVKAPALADLDSLDKVLSRSGTDIILPWTKSVLSKLVTGLTSSQTTAFAVLVKDEKGSTAAYLPAEVTTLYSPPPVIGAPIALSNVTDVGFTSAWGGSSSSNSFAENLEYRGVIAGDRTLIDTASEALALTGSNVVFDWTKDLSGFEAVGLAGHTSYAFAVLVRDEAGGLALYEPVSFTTKAHRLIFKTASTFTATQLSPASSTDAICNAEKPASRGTFKAMIASPERQACSSRNCETAGTDEQIDWVMRANTVYENSNGIVVWATNSAGIPNTIQHGIIQPNGTLGDVWTGLDVDWRKSADNCSNWTSASNGVIGALGASNAANGDAWANFAASCSIQAGFYCVEQ